MWLSGLLRLADFFSTESGHITELPRLKVEKYLHTRIDHTSLYLRDTACL
jgi:hypothetical protein